MEKEIVKKTIHNNMELIEYRIKNEYLEFCFVNVGGSITKIALAEDAFEKNLVASYQNVEDYVSNSCYLNAIVGRTSNRITDGKFMLEGKEVQVDLNDGPNNLHGGAQNLTHSVFDVSEITDGYRLKATLLDQPNGFPGNIEVTVDYTLNKNQIEIKYQGTTDQTTIFNPTQHAYFNLSGDLERTVYGHILQVNGDQVADINEASSFTKELLSVEGTRFDFRAPTVIDPRDKPESDLFDRATGYDHLYVLNETEHAATFYDPTSGRKLEVFTTEPAMQLYLGNHMSDELLFENNRVGESHLAACFETHQIPFDFESQVLKPEETYEQITRWVFSKA